MPQIPSVGESVTATIGKLTPFASVGAPVVGGITAQWVGVIVGAALGLCGIVVKALIDIYFKRKHYRLAVARAGWDEGDEP